MYMIHDAPIRLQHCLDVDRYSTIYEEPRITRGVLKKSCKAPELLTNVPLICEASHMIRAMLHRL